MLPQGEWYCPNCTCKFCGIGPIGGGTAAEANGTTGSALFMCSICEKKCNIIFSSSSTSNLVFRIAVYCFCFFLCLVFRIIPTSYNVMPFQTMERVVRWMTIPLILRIQQKHFVERRVERYNSYYFQFSNVISKIIHIRAGEALYNWMHWLVYYFLLIMLYTPR